MHVTAEVCSTGRHESAASKTSRFRLETNPERPSKGWIIAGLGQNIVWILNRAGWTWTGLDLNRTGSEQNLCFGPGLVDLNWSGLG